MYSESVVYQLVIVFEKKYQFQPVGSFVYDQAKNKYSDLWKVNIMQRKKVPKIGVNKANLLV